MLFSSPDVTYITTFKTAYTLLYSVYYISKNSLFHLKTDNACYRKNRYQDTSLSVKRIYQFAFKFLLNIHAHLHLQNSIYLNFLHLQRNDLPKIIDFKIHKQRK